LQGEKSIVTLGVILLFYGLSQEEDIFFRVGRKERLCTTENQRPELPWAVPPRDASGAGFAASPLAGPAPHTRIAPQISPHS